MRIYFCGGFEYSNTAGYSSTFCCLQSSVQKTLSGMISLTMAGLEVRASSLLIRASSCCMSAGGGSMRTGSRQDSVDSWTPWSGHDKASNSRDRSWMGTENLPLMLNKCRAASGYSSFSTIWKWTCSDGSSLLTAGNSVTWTCLGSLLTMLDRAFR